MNKNYLSTSTNSITIFKLYENQKVIEALKLYDMIKELNCKKTLNKFDNL